MNKLALLLTTAALASCAGAQKPQWFDVSELKPVQEDKAPAVILKAHERITSKDAGKFSVIENDVHFAMQIVTQAGLKAAQWNAETEEDETIEDLHARSIDPDGTIHELEQGDVFDDQSEVETTDKDLDKKREDVKHKVWRVPGAKVGSIIEVSYRRVVKEHWLGSTTLGFEEFGTLPVKRLETEILVNDRILWAARPYNTDIPVKQDREGNLTRLSWTLTDLPGHEDEDFSTDASRELPWLAFRVKQLDHGPFAADHMHKWEDLLRNVGDQLTVKDDLFDKPAPVFDCKDVPCKIDAALAEARKTPLYAGRGWLRSARPVSEILDSKQANAVDKEVLLLHYLRGAGLEARPAAFIEPNTFLQDFDFPFAAYNHLAIYLPVQQGLAKAVWIDPTCEECAAGQLTDALVGADAWVIDAHGRFLYKSDIKLERLHPEGSGPPANESVVKAEMNVDAAGTLEATRSEEGRGIYAVKERLNRRGWVEPDWKDFGTWVAREVASTAHVTELPTGTCDAAAGTCVSHVKLEAPAYATVASDKLVVPLSAMRVGDDGLFSPRERTNGISFWRPSVVRAVARIKVPAGYHLAELPPKSEVQAPGLQTVMETAQDGDAVVVTRTLRFIPGLYAASSYDEHRKVARAFTAAKNSSLTFVKSSAPVLPEPKLQ